MKVMNTQFAAIFGLPIGIQIHDHRVRPTAIVAKLVKVFFIKTPFFVERVMKFVACYIGITRLIEKQHEGIHEIEKRILMDVFMFSVEPINFVAAH
ncbi:MAG: hypothetical protein RLZZ292_184 [Bacteroidota bacterium]